MTNDVEFIRETLEILHSAGKVDFESQPFVEKTEKLHEIIINYRAGCTKGTPDKAIMQAFLECEPVRILDRLAYLRRKKLFDAEDKTSNFASVYLNYFGCIAHFVMPEEALRQMLEKGLFKVLKEELSSEELKSHMHESMETSQSSNAAGTCFAPMIATSRFEGISTFVRELCISLKMVETVKPYLESKYVPYIFKFSARDTD